MYISGRDHSPKAANASVCDWTILRLKLIIHVITSKNLVVEFSSLVFFTDKEGSVELIRYQ